MKAIASQFWMGKCHDVYPGSSGGALQGKKETSPIHPGRDDEKEIREESPLQSDVETRADDVRL